MNDIFQLVYTSMRAENCTDTEIEKILAASKKNNAPLGITGLLIVVENRFIQCLEGDKDKVLALYEKITKDSRHSDSFIVSSQEVSKRAFPTWDMAFKNITKVASLEFKSLVGQQEQDVYRAVLSGKAAEQSAAINVMQRLFKISK